MTATDADHGERHEVRARFSYLRADRPCARHLKALRGIELSNSLLAIGAVKDADGHKHDLSPIHSQPDAIVDEYLAPGSPKTFTLNVTPGGRDHKLDLRRIYFGVPSWLV